MAAIPHVAQYLTEGSIDMESPPLCAPLYAAIIRDVCAIATALRGIARDALRYLKNIDATGTAMPCSAMGGVVKLGHQGWILFFSLQDTKEYVNHRPT